MFFKREKQYVAEGIDLPVVTQAETLDELARNVQEAVGLHLADVDFGELDLDAAPSVLFNVELPAHA